MRFAEPNFLWALFTLPLFLLLFVYAYRRRKKLASKFASISMLPKIATSLSPWRRATKTGLLLLGIAFLIVALARPQWGRQMEHIERKGLDILLLQDVSLSMLAEDVKPNRLVRSRHEISAFLDTLSGDRVGLVAFSGEAQTLVPLTLDYGTVQLILRDLEPGWLLPGTDLAAAIDKGMQMFRRSKVPSKYAVMVLMSDGEEQDAKAVEKAKEAAEAGIRIYTVGIGSKEGVPIPEPTKNGDVSYQVLYRDDFKGDDLVAAADKLGFPLVIKDPVGGSSIGMGIAKNMDEAGEIVNRLFKNSARLLCEKFIRGGEASCGYMEGLEKPLPPTEMRMTTREYFDYEAKYNGECREVTPAEFPQELTERIQQLSKKAHLAIGGAGYSRTDVRIDADGKLWALETNTLPGMTPTSILPAEAAAIGISYSELIDRIIETSLKIKR